MHGIARYVYHLLQGWRTVDDGYQFYVFASEDSPLWLEGWPSHIQIIEMKSDWISLKEQVEIPRFLKKLGVDLFHSPSFVAPIGVPCKMVMTIHDLNHVALPQFYTPFHQFYYQVIVRGSVRRSQYILTVSNFSKKEITRTLGLPPEKVFVTYNGVSEKYRPIRDRLKLDYVRELYGLSDRFVLCVSNNKPHKNVHQLVRAYCYSDIEIPLVLASPFDPSLTRIADNYGKKHLLYFSKFIDEDHLPAVYSMTDLFVYPSTYEGFGLPPLEALACGAPVVVARSSSLPEVVGESAIFANPYDFRAIAEALELGINDEGLRLRLVERGLKHSKSFSWERMTADTLDVYQKCIQGAV